MPVKRTTLTCRGPLAPRPSSCPKRPAKDCPYLLCTTCCIARGGWGFCGCQVDRHRTYINHAHYFEPNFSFPSPTPHRPYYLPVVSPLSGDFTRPSGFAYMDCIAEGWDSEVGQARLEAEATARFLNEGITVYIFIWAKVCIVYICAHRALSDYKTGEDRTRDLYAGDSTGWCLVPSRRFCPSPPARDIPVERFQTF